jgi:transposase
MGRGRKDAPREYGPYKTLFNRLSQSAKARGIFENIFHGILKKLRKAESLLMHSAYSKAPTSCGLKKWRRGGELDARKAV